jgi:sporulation protein YlmC with PRC-barrel domain
MSLKTNFEKTVEELALQVPFKDVTEVGEVVLMVRESEKGQCTITFAQVVKFTQEMVGKQEWWHVDLIFLTLPLSYGTLILKSEHLSNMEVFTSGGKKVFLKAINTKSLLDNWLPDQLPRSNSPGLKTSGPSRPNPGLTLVK